MIDLFAWNVWECTDEIDPNYRMWKDFIWVCDNPIRKKIFYICFDNYYNFKEIHKKLGDNLMMSKDTYPLKIHKRNLQRHLKLMVEKGILVTKQQKNKRGRPILYTLPFNGDKND